MLALKWNTGRMRALWMKQKWPRRDGLNTFCVAWSLCQISPTSVGSSLELSKPLASLQATSCWGGLHARSSCRNNRRHRGWLQWSRTTAYPSSAPDSSRTSPLMEGDSSFPKWRLFEKITMRDYISLGSHVRKKPTPLGDAYTRESRYQSLLLPPNDTSDEDWLSASLDLANSLGIDPASATETQHRRVFHLYLPVYFWLRQLLLSGRHRPNDGVARSSATSSPSSTQHQVERYTGECGHNALVVGISAPQGCGKSTLVEEMRRMLVKAKHPCSVLSIDDFYLTGSEQDALAAAHPSNSLLQVRGNAGTHDLALGLRTIRSLKYGVEQTSSSLSSSSSSAVRDTGSSFRIPRYDKSARGGRGDRAPEEQWSAVPVMPEIVILEGWMLGFEALPEGSPLLDYDGEYDNKANQGDRSFAGGGDESLRVVNTFLRDYRELHDEVDAWLVLKTADPEMVFEWRAEAERRMRDAGRPGMSEEQVRDFCARYMPAYRAYLPGLYDRATSAERRREGLGRCREYEQEGNKGGMKEAFLIEVGRDRNPVRGRQDEEMI